MTPPYSRCSMPFSRRLGRQAPASVAAFQELRSGVTGSDTQASSANEDQAVRDIPRAARVSKQKASARSSLCPFLCPLGPALGLLGPADSGIARGQERQIVRPVWVYTCSCRDSAILSAAS